MNQPQRFAVRVNIGPKLTTSIKHDDYHQRAEVVLNLDEFQLYEPHLDESSICFDSDPLNRKLPNLLTHEFGHFIDACLSQTFRYCTALRPSDRRHLVRLYHLWDSYIDGRLGSLAPYKLEERIEEATSVGKLDRNLVEKAWQGEFKTYPELVNAAS